MAYTTESFIKKVTEIHKGKYDYRKVDYKGSTKKVTIICPIHGEFQQTPMLHIQGCGCPKCGKIKSAAAQKQTIDEWIIKEVIDTLHQANITLLKITGLDSPQEISKKNRGE